MAKVIQVLWTRLASSTGGFSPTIPSGPVSPRVVHPPLTRLVHKWKLPQAAHLLIGRRHRRRGRWLHANLLRVRYLQDRICVRRCHHLPEAHAESEQITHRDWSVRGYSVVERPVESLQNRALSQFREPPIHWLVQPQLAFLYQDHCRNCRNRFGH